MPRYTLLVFAAGWALLCQPASAQSASYHLERLQIQARAFLATMTSASPPPADGQTSVEQQLQQTTSNSVWSQQMVTDDVNKILETSAELAASLQEPEPESLLSARSTVESLARRLRVSSAALALSPESKTQLDFLMLELDESARVMDVQREQLLAQEQQRQRSRSSIGVGLGFGYGWGGDWGVPCGWGSYYPYGYGFGGFPRYSGWGGRVYGVGRGCR